MDSFIVLLLIIVSLVSVLYKKAKREGSEFSFGDEGNDDGDASCGGGD